MTIFALFDADGYECKSLVGVFSCKANADVAAHNLRLEVASEWRGLNRIRKLKGADPRRITVEELPVDHTQED